MRLVDADAFSAFIKDAVIKHKYDRLNIDNTLTVADVLQTVCAELDGTGLDGFKNAPTVDAAPIKHGQWIYEERDRLDHETDDGRVFRTEKWWKCSECGNAKGYIGHKPSDKFCSRCGADMRKDGDDDGV